MGHAWAIHGQCVGKRGQFMDNVWARVGDWWAAATEIAVLMAATHGHAWSYVACCRIQILIEVADALAMRANESATSANASARIGTDWAQIGMHWHRLACIGTDWHG